VFRLDHQLPIGTLDLSNAIVGTVDSDEPSWPRGENLHLDGFTYSDISSDLKDESFREGWLPVAKPGQFSIQPYHQLARVLRDLGDKDGANQVLYLLETRSREYARLKLTGSKLVSNYGEEFSASVSASIL
jgi:hypothetical protein